MAQIQHVFVLMLENRAFDHMLGFSGISGTDAESGAATSLNGLSGSESNAYGGVTGTVSQPAEEAMQVDPGHEFADVLCQLCGPNATYAPGGAYPPIDNSGFMASYANAVKHAQQTRDPAEIMKCYAASQLPVLNALAAAFAVCDAWYASMPGPTWPNRMFVHAASSAGLDHSPTTAEIALWETLSGGYAFANGTIFDRLATKGIGRRLYAGDLFPMMSALKGIRLDDIRQYSQFAGDLQKDFPYSYVFIEPSYDLQNDYRGSTSQHPLGDIRRGEALIKSTYETIRQSSLWPSSLLIVLWDEHGGFYDHAIPPAAVTPGDSKPGTGHNKYGFTFEQYGVRVPALIISPWVPANTIDHRVYDHSSVPATIEALFGLQPLTARDGAANSVLPLLSLASPRDDTPTTLPEPEAGALPHVAVAPGAPVRPHDPVNEGNLPVVINAAMRQDIEMSPEDRETIIARVAGLKTRAEAIAYLDSVAAKRAAAAGAAQP